MVYLENEIPQNVTGMVQKSIDEMAKATSQVLETFLCEYCEVNGIKEEELKTKLALEHSGATGITTIKELESGRVYLRSSFERNGEELKFTLTTSFFLYDKEKFPKTLALIREKNVKSR